MPNTLDNLYNLVFGDAAKVRAIPANLTPEQRHRIEETQKERKQTIKSDLAFITENPSLSLELRNMLRIQNNVDLEILLYNNNTDELKALADDRNIPTDEEIKAQFAALNQEYGYFKADKTTIDAFVKLFKASKLIADYIENNNSDDNVVAYTHAYKMMVLFGSQTAPKTIDNLIDKQQLSYSPVHDTLVLPIPKNNPALKHLAEWQTLIKRHGAPVIRFFQQAHEIEKILAEEKGPFTLGAIQNAASQIKYPRITENPELAKLCVQYNVSEEEFNQCLEIQPKQSDQLPNIIVDGNTVGQRGYFLVKLPVDDPRAYILGHITHCCQSIGGHSEQCVIDGITQDKNGFYVLLEAKEGATQPPMSHGQINYDDYEIVGQGYAWLSELDNLTFDSWENRTPSSDDTVIQAMLPEFARQCFEQKPSIGRVTIGTGGKTPEFYTDHCEEITHPEKIAVGFQYNDSRAQVLIATNPKIQKISHKIQEDFQQMGINITPDLWFMKQAESLSNLLSKETISFYQNIGLGSTYLELVQRASTQPNLLHLMTQLNQSQDLNTERINLLLSILNNTKETHHIKSILEILYQSNPNSMTSENFKLLMQHEDQDAKDIANGLELLSRTSPTLITEENFKLLAQHGQDAVNISAGLVQIYEASPDLITEENSKLLAQHWQHAYGIGCGLSALHKVNPTLVTQENFTLFVQNEQHAHNIKDVLSNLPPDLITQENFTLLAQKGQHAQDINYALYSLSKHSSDLMTPEICLLLIQNGQDARNIASELNSLGRINRALVTEENCKLLIQNGRFAKEIINEFTLLAKKSPALLTNEKLKAIIENIAKPTAVTPVANPEESMQQALKNDKPMSASELKKSLEIIKNQDSQEDTNPTSTI